MDAQDEVRIDARLRSRAEELAAEFADSSSTAADLNLLGLLLLSGKVRLKLDDYWQQYKMGDFEPRS